ncbi:hypothetical protein WN71_018245 [Streptomyces mangrovisoli]|uniref:Uncharacterized protein n=2 Tax=Streptomyces mangrovisoli TaxID=1428628 RepID=A0A1J4NZ50_9ACTN|nr:hypothetical protein WN71_018245 [Streptomyces mangrovisoli]
MQPLPIVSVPLRVLPLAVLAMSIEQLPSVTLSVVVKTTDVEFSARVKYEMSSGDLSPAPMMLVRAGSAHERRTV